MDLYINFFFFECRFLFLVLVGTEDLNDKVYCLWGFSRWLTFFICPDGGQYFTLRCLTGKFKNNIFFFVEEVMLEIV